MHGTIMNGKHTRGIKMEQNASTSIVREIMMEYADLTGLLSDKVAPRRYLWTDAFAICNFLELYHQTGDDHFIELALHLVGQVHHVLGQHRNDDPRTGWISGLDEQRENASHQRRFENRQGNE